MNDIAIALALHVLAVVLWIGGVAMVTTVLMPAVERFKAPAERVAFFEQVERRFARQSRATTLIAGGSGFYLLHRTGLEALLWTLQGWWLGAMILVWLIFSLMLFVLEPLVLHRWLQERAARDPERAFFLIRRLHWVLLALSVVTVVGAAAGSHGLTFGP
jgi:uncharacterized membrane protein